MALTTSATASHLLLLLLVPFLTSPAAAYCLAASHSAHHAASQQPAPPGQPVPVPQRRGVSRLGLRVSPPLIAPVVRQRTVARSLQRTGGGAGRSGMGNRRWSLLREAIRGQNSGVASPVLAESHLVALLQLQQAWGAWAGNSNASTVCSAWAGVTCSPKGLVVALDTRALPIDPPPSGSIPASITNLATLQYLDLSYVDLEGPIPSLASLTRLTHLFIGTDGCRLTGTLDGLSWLTSLRRLRTLGLLDLSRFTGDLSFLAILSRLESLQDLTIISLSNATGEIPREIRYLTNLTALDVSFLRALDFPKWVTQLSNLQYLNTNTDEPRRQGVLPERMSELTALTSLSLAGNNLEGGLFKSWSTLVNLEDLNLSDNHLQGDIPETFSALTALTALDLSWNYLSGEIPQAFASNIQTLSLSYNAFDGRIPPHLALPSLIDLALSSNLFTGAIPSTFTCLTGVSTLSLTNNSLSEGLEVLAQMTWLTDIFLDSNNFSGVFPMSFTAFENLLYIEIGNNRFSGPFPESLLAHKGLQALSLRNNSFAGSIPQQLTELVNLAFIDLADNNFHGLIPPELFQLPQLLSLQLGSNFFSGVLPVPIVASPTLKLLALDGNGLTGMLPDFARWNVSIRSLALSNNNFTGSIPNSISTLTNLDSIILNNNQLSGSIPTSIFNMTNLRFLYLANNHLSGSLPSDISRLEKLEQLWLDNNNIEGPLPSVICSIPWLWRIMVSNNRLYGPLPDCLFNKCVNQIDVSNNSLYGRINRNFKNMVADGDALINLGHNFFFGDAVLFAAGCQVCPVDITEPNILDIADTSSGQGAGKCIIGITSMKDYSVAGAGKGARVSLSGNCLMLSPDADCPSNATQRSTAACQAFCSITDNGPCDGHGECVPPAPASTSTFTCLCDAGYSTINMGNGSTCAIVNSTTTTTSVSSLSTGAIVGIAVGCFAGSTLLAAVVAWLLWPRRPKKWEGLDVCEQFSLQQMVRATNNWSDDNVLGKGGFGIVYKGCSPHGQLWAIKRSKIMTNDFETEVRAMASLHHSHLVRLLGFCLDQNVETGKQEQILVYEFVGNRDLEYHIYKTKSPLSLRQRLRLAQGAAEGLAYLHGFETPIVHRDIKPANILVTADFQAKVADFGLLKLLTHGDADATRVAGTPGYVDPDYNQTSVITAKSDVNSFGVVLMELLSGMSPQDTNESHMREWARKKMEAFQLDDLKDSRMPEVSREAVVDIADLALDCMKSPGTRRPSMKEVAYRLNALIEKHCPDKEKEDDSGSLGEEESASSGGFSSKNVSSMLFGDGGRDSQRSTGSRPSAISSRSIGSTPDGVRSWLHLTPSRGY